MANSRLTLYKRSRDLWWYRHEADQVLFLTLLFRKIQFCSCLIRQWRELGRDL